MHSNSRLLHAPLLACAALAVALAPSAWAAKFPALNTPASSEHIPGKLVWADLFTNNPDEATRFYTSLLGWTAQPLEQKGKGYVVFMNNGQPVAGIVTRAMQGKNHPARWIGYFSVADINAALANVTRGGGMVRAPAHSFPDRGTQAIFSDPDGTPVGVIQSSTGDPADTDPAPGGWNWFEVYSKSPKEAGDFYHNAIGLDIAPETNSDRKSDFVLSSAGHPRGGVAPTPEEGSDNLKPAWLGVIRVADLDATLAKVPSLGGEVVMPPRSVEYGSRFAIILDSTGGTVGLVQYTENANPANTP
jgi:hypothetical protein